MSNLGGFLKLKERATPPKLTGCGDPEIQAMNQQADLLSLIESDTGEHGRVSGDRIDFHSCPICGHRDCFSYYPPTNSWHCFGDSNDSGFAGGSFTEYVQATRRAADYTEAVTMLRDATGNPYEGAPGREAKATQDGQDGDRLLLPTWTAIQATSPPSRNAPLIHNILRLGHVALLAAKGKAGKSWSAVELSIAVATGGVRGGFGCERGDVLDIDPEIDRNSLDNRFAATCEALNVDSAKIDSHVAKWALRGVEGATMSNIIHDLEIRRPDGSFALIVVDSASVFVEGDENSSVDIRRFAAKVLRMTSITGAAVLLVHHFGKGSAGDRDTADRARGSSVWLDFPDATLYLTEIFPQNGEIGDYLHDGERAFLLESGGLREFPIMEPKHLIFAHPIHRVDVEGITEGWKPTSARRSGGKSTAEVNKAKAEANRANIAAALLSHYYTEGIGEDGLLLKDAAEVAGVDPRTLTTALDGSDVFEIVQVTQRKRYVRPKHPPRASPPELPLAD